MHVKARDGTNLYVETVGERGDPILFVHEFGGNYDAWEPQLNAFARTNRCITYAARGYAPSDIPKDLDSYSQAIAASDAVDVLDGLGIEKAHVVGLSMGGFTALHVGLDYAARTLSLTVAGAGYGSEKGREAYFREVSMKVAENFEADPAGFSSIYALGASRVQFQNKDPRGWTAFADRLARHSAVGAPNTMRAVQARRPPFWQLEDRLRQMTVPTLVMVGDEDDHCLQPGLYLKRMLPAVGLAVLPKTGHTLNLEEPALFNLLLADFFRQVGAGSWGTRDPRADPEQVMRTK